MGLTAEAKDGRVLLSIGSVRSGGEASRRGREYSGVSIGTNDQGRKLLGVQECGIGQHDGLK